jgi:hypothetical protein
MGQIKQEIEKEVLPAPTDYTRLPLTLFGKSRVGLDFANPERYLLRGREGCPGRERIKDLIYGRNFNRLDLV